jgi:hypothetical protein
MTTPQDALAAALHARPEDYPRGQWCGRRDPDADFAYHHRQDAAQAARLLATLAASGWTLAPVDCECVNHADCTSECRCGGTQPAPDPLREAALAAMREHDAFLAIPLPPPDPAMHFAQAARMKEAFDALRAALAAPDRPDVEENR